MTREELIQIVSEDTQKILNSNLENSLRKILENVSFDDPAEMCLKMCKNTVTVSVQTSVQVLLDALCLLGVVSPEAYSLPEVRPELRLILGGLSDKNKE
jgi:hypothetical protein|nr:MAG TPA: hypothetical protein [Caudoviricetes sp.]